MENHITRAGKAESGDNSKQVYVYETFSSGNNFSLSKSSLKSEVEKLQYAELDIKYQDINPVYTKLSQKKQTILIGCLTREQTQQNNILLA